MIKEPVRVLQVFGRLDRGGAETMIMNLYREINRQELQFDFVVHTEDQCAYYAEIFSMGGVIYHAPRYTGKNHLGYIRWWDNFFVSHPQYRIIHSHVRSTASLIFKMAKKHHCITMVHSHNTSNGKGFEAIIKKTLQSQITRYADYLWACSENAGKWLFGNKRFSVINNGIDANSFAFNSEVSQNLRSSLGIQENETVFGHVGRFCRQKNHTFLLNIFAEIQRTNPISKLLLVGTGELEEEIKQNAKNLNIIDNIIFAGVRSDVNDVMQAMDVFLLPSLYEGLPVTLVEAQAAGLPCLISDVISSEIMLTDLIRYYSLKASAAEWAKKAISLANIERKNTTTDIIAAGYDVCETARRLSAFYLEILLGNDFCNM